MEEALNQKSEHVLKLVVEFLIPEVKASVFFSFLVF